MFTQTWSSEEIRELARIYPLEGADSASSSLGRSVDSVTSMARRLGVPAETRRIRQALSKATNSSTVNARFFDDVTPEVAYVLGFLAAGGIKTGHRCVLRIAVDEERGQHLAYFLRLIESRHQVQQYGNRLLVEVGNSFLVKRLLENFNWPPRQHSPDPPMPILPVEFVPSFAQGHLHRSGVQGARVIRWTGTHKQTDQLAQAIQTATGVGDPSRIQYGALLNIAWTDSREVKVLADWLAGSRISTA